ncbi:MAG: AMP-binding enzyme family protein [Solimicrobium sp.]|nr:AMP-binding enzyme family protein [Solimicrobium sp.]
MNKLLDNFCSKNLPARFEWPEFLFDHPQLRYSSPLNCAQELLKCVALNPSKIVFIGSDCKLSYAQLHAQVNQISHVLRDQMQLTPGNRVLLLGPNHPMLAACILAVWQIGCVAVPSMPMLRAKELSAMIEHAEISAALCNVNLKKELLSAQAQYSVLKKIVYYGAKNEENQPYLETFMTQKSTEFTPHETHPEDVCLISFTSGTTGKPKATAHFHRDIMAICDCFPVSILRSCADDVFIGTASVAFTFGLGGLVLFPLRAGATAVLLENYSPESLLQAIEAYKASICFTVPTVYRQMTPLAHHFNLSGLQKTVSAGEMLPLATRTDWYQVTGLKLIDGIGTTEMLHIFISAADKDIRPGAMGKAVPGYHACVLDEDGQPAAAGVIGRLAVKGPTGCRYLSDPRQSNYVCNGWNVTGDTVEMDSDGYFWYHARVDDMIISSGYNIAAPEVEEVLLQHPAVADCGVIGVFDEARGQIVKAFIVLRRGVCGDQNMVHQLQTYVKQNLAPYKYPRAIEFIHSLPRTDSGKLQRFRLSEM